MEMKFINFSVLHREEITLKSYDFCLLVSPKNALFGFYENKNCKDKKKNGEIPQ